MAPKHTITGPHGRYRRTRALAPERTTSGPQRSEYSVASRGTEESEPLVSTCAFFGLKRNVKGCQVAGFDLPESNILHSGTPSIRSEKYDSMFSSVEPVSGGYFPPSYP